MRENTLWVTVDGDYKFPQVELSAMADNMGRMIQDIDKLDRYRTTMMEELKHLRDIVRFIMHKTEFVSRLFYCTV